MTVQAVLRSSEKGRQVSSGQGRAVICSQESYGSIIALVFNNRAHQPDTLTFPDPVTPNVANSPSRP